MFLEQAKSQVWCCASPDERWRTVSLGTPSAKVNSLETHV